jgi:hypothetical protein
MYQNWGINEGNLASLKNMYEALLLKTGLATWRILFFLPKPQLSLPAHTVALIKALCYLVAKSDKSNVGGRYELNEYVLIYVSNLHLCFCQSVMIFTGIVKEIRDQRC